MELGLGLALGDQQEIAAAGAAAPSGDLGELQFNDAVNSGLLVLLEDI